MAKRLTDTNKWKKNWFFGLKPLYKLFWNYLCDNCTHAGIWDVNFVVAFMLIGEPLDESEIRKKFADKYIEFDNGKKWFLPDFIDFQYGILNPNVNAHNSAIRELEREGLYEQFINSSLNSSSTVKDKNKDKVKDKNKEKDKINEYYIFEGKLHISQFDYIELNNKGSLVALEATEKDFKSHEDWRVYDRARNGLKYKHLLSSEEVPF